MLEISASELPKSDFIFSNSAFTTPYSANFSSSFFPISSFLVFNASIVSGEGVICWRQVGQTDTRVGSIAVNSERRFLPSEIILDNSDSFTLIAFLSPPSSTNLPCFPDISFLRAVISASIIDGSLCARFFSSNSVFSCSLLSMPACKREEVETKLFHA